LTTNSSAKNARLEQERKEREARDKRGGLNNPKNLIREAYDDSKSDTPIFFFVVHSVNIKELIEKFLEIKNAGMGPKIPIRPFSMSKGIEDEVKEMLDKAVHAGEWLLLENMHLVEDWLPQFMEKYNSLMADKNNVSPKFRLWLTSIPHE
jgi:dynein heavy chain